MSLFAPAGQAIISPYSCTFLLPSPLLPSFLPVVMVSVGDSSTYPASKGYSYGIVGGLLSAHRQALLPPGQGFLLSSSWGPPGVVLRPTASFSSPPQACGVLLGSS